MIDQKIFTNLIDGLRDFIALIETGDLIYNPERDQANITLKLIEIIKSIEEIDKLNNT